MKNRYFAVQLAVLLSFLFLLSTAAFAQDTYQYRADRISTQGRIMTMTREGDQYRITLNHGGYSYYVPVATVENRDLRVGDRVRIDGLVNGDVVNADMIAFPGEPNFARDPMYRGVPYGSSGWMSGAVQDVNRRLGYLTVRDDANGATYRIDVRHMNTARSVNVWRLRPGDHISINGSWENRDLFDAIRVEY